MSVVQGAEKCLGKKEKDKEKRLQRAGNSSLCLRGKEQKKGRSL